ncbi:MAG: caspase family protein [Hyphomicrobiales bacterium]|nr:caspase family protein [Hyphomicrobiales bacterium]
MSRVVPAAGFVLLLLIQAVLGSGPARAETAPTAFQDAQTRVALVIGASTYRSVDPLANPLNDATAMAKTLKRLRFDVVEIFDPTVTDLEAGRAEFLQKAEGADIALLYYAGHAVQIDGRNYMLPIDATLEDAATVDTELFNVSRIVNAMDSRAKTKIVILDACRDNPFRARLEAIYAARGKSRSVGRGLATIDLGDALEGKADEGYNTFGSIIAFAAAPGATASDGAGSHSPYTNALLKYLETEGLEVGRMFRLAAADVLAATNGTQKPEYLVRLTDEVYFSRPQPAQCDFLAIAPYNGVGIPGVEFDDLKPLKAIKACEAALESEPDHPRYLHNLGRAYDAGGDFDTAVEFYRKSADLGYVPAISNLGVMNVNGQGTPQNFDEGVRLLKIAAKRGYHLAKVSLRSADFTQLFEAEEFRKLEEELARRGYFNGAPDGEYDDAAKAALADFQKDNDLSANGATLETLDRLGLLGIIPAYTLN